MSVTDAVNVCIGGQNMSRVVALEYVALGSGVGKGYDHVIKPHM